MTSGINQVVGMTDSKVRWGLKLFPDVAGALCGVATGVVVPVGLANASAIAGALAAHTSANGGLATAGATPTRLAEQAAEVYLAALPDPNPKFLLLATDGQPDCAGVDGGQGGDDAPGTVAAISSAFSAGFPTFVVGIATQTNSGADATLQQMASAGGIARAASPPYYPAASTADLVAALNQLVTTTVHCSYAVGTPPRGSSVDAIDVYGDGTLIPRDPTRADGWDYVDISHASIELHGPTCAAAISGALQSVAVAFRCPPGG